jgi:hypothetical protein
MAANSGPIPLIASNIAAGGRLGRLFHSQQCVPRDLHGLDLFEKKFKPIELTVDERFKMLREGAVVAGLEFLQPLPPVAAQRLISGYALAE